MTFLAVHAITTHWVLESATGVDKDGKRNQEFQWHFYSREEMKALCVIAPALMFVFASYLRLAHGRAIKKHGGTLEALSSFMAPKIAAATRRYELRMIRYKKASLAYDTDYWQPSSKPPGAPRKPSGFEKDRAKAEASYQKRLLAHERNLKIFDLGLSLRKRPRKPSEPIITQGDRADCYEAVKGYASTHVRIGYVLSIALSDVALWVLCQISRL